MHDSEYPPSPPLLTHGVVKAKGGAVNESILVDDLKGFVDGAIRLLHGVAKGDTTAAAAAGAEGGKERIDEAPTGYTNR